MRMVLSATHLTFPRGRREHEVYSAMTGISITLFNWSIVLQVLETASEGTE
jgi:hypothetical protein